MIFADMNNFAFSNFGKELTITSTISTPREDKKLGRKSLSHQRKLAIDIRTKDVSAFDLQELLEYINNKEEYKQYHYLSNSGEHRLAFFHNDNSGEHIHLAIHAKYKDDL